MPSPLAKRPPNGLFGFCADRFTRPFWDAATGHILQAPRCGRCDTYRMPPTPFCPQCHSQELDWVTLSGHGIVYSYTVVMQAILPDMQSCLPYVPAVISLEGAGEVRLVSNIVDVQIDAVAVGMPVTVVWDEVNGITVPRFTAK